MNVKYFQGLFLLTGTIIGVGVFALPYVVSEAGFLIGMAELAILTGAVLLIHLMYADISVSLESPHQLPGYVEKYLGMHWRGLASVVSVLNLLGSLVVYAILGTQFLSVLLDPWLGEAKAAAILVFLAGGLVVFFYDSFFATEIDSALTVLLIFFMIILIGAGLRHGAFNFTSSIEVSKVALPYGVILFALTGASVIPRVRQALRGSESSIRSVVIWGTLIPAILYVGFIFSVLAASEPLVSKDAISGLSVRLGSSAIFLGALVGFLATITSYIGVGLTFKNLLRFDFKAPKALAWLFTALLPFVFVGFGVSDFIKIIGLVGAVMIGIESVMILIMWQRLPRRRLLPAVPGALRYSLLSLFLLGVAYEFAVFFG